MKGCPTLSLLIYNDRIMLTCEICGKADIKTGQGMAGHKQFAHKQLTSGGAAHSSATLASEDMVLEHVVALEHDLQEEFQEQLKLLERQLERRTLKLGSKAEISSLEHRVEDIEATMSAVVEFVASLSTVLLHLDQHQRGESHREPYFRSSLGDVGVEWWKEEVYEGNREIVVQELKARS